VNTTTGFGPEEEDEEDDCAGLASSVIVLYDESAEFFSTYPVSSFIFLENGIVIKHQLSLLTTFP
jgi:hypothetical protein